jgi:hypothetical protein
MKLYQRVLVCMLVPSISSCVVNGMLRPDVPICTILTSGDCHCSYKEQDYKTKCTAFVATDPESYGKMQDYLDKTEKRLADCLRSPKLCK